jgi:hypothetical protein
VVYRALGWVYLAIAIAMAVRDALAWWADGVFRLASLGELWSGLDVASLSSVQATVQRHLSVYLWAWVVRPALAIPAVIAFVALALALLWLGRQRAALEPHVLTGSRPRRRRSRSALS